MQIRVKICQLLLTLLLAHPLFAQNAGTVLNGTWTATAGTQVFRGSWSAAISRHSPEAAQGSWTLVNDSGETILQGSWSARRTGPHWHGTWSARRTGPHWHGTWRARATQGQALSGTWDAEIDESTAKSFQDMLLLTIEKQIGGWWRSGGREGNWWLKAQPDKKSTKPKLNSREYPAPDRRPIARTAAIASCFSVA